MEAKFTKANKNFITNNKLILSSVHKSEFYKNLEKYSIAFNESIKQGLVGMHITLYRKLIKQLDPIISDYDFDDHWIQHKTRPYCIIYISRNGEVRPELSMNFYFIYRTCKTRLQQYMFMMNLFHVLSLVAEDPDQIASLKNIYERYKNKIEEISEDTEESDSSSDSDQLDKVFEKLGKKGSGEKLGGGLQGVMKGLGIDVDKLGELMKPRDESEESDEESEDQPKKKSKKPKADDSDESEEEEKIKALPPSPSLASDSEMKPSATEIIKNSVRETKAKVKALK